MKKTYLLSLLPGLALVLSGPLAQGQISVSGPVTLHTGPDGLMATPSCLTLGSGAILINEGQLDVGGGVLGSGCFGSRGQPGDELQRAGRPRYWPLPATLSDATGRRLAEFRTTRRVSENLLCGRGGDAVERGVPAARDHYRHQPGAEAGA